MVFGKGLVAMKRLNLLKINMKDKLQKTLENPKGKVICVDVDGFLTKTIWFPGDNPPEPNEDIVKYVNKLYDKMAIIIVHTARRGCSYNETVGWLIYHGVKFTAVAINLKPPADVYLDDHCVNIDDVKL